MTDDRNTKMTEAQEKPKEKPQEKPEEKKPQEKPQEKKPQEKPQEKKPQEKPQEKKPITKKPQEKFPCGICNNPYSKSYLKVHMKTHEKKIKEESGKLKEPSTIEEIDVKKDQDDMQDDAEAEKLNSIQVEVHVRNEANEERREVIQEQNTEDEDDEETEIEMREHLEDFELAEVATKVSQELKEAKENKKKALGPDAEFLLTTQNGLLIQEMFESIDLDNLLDESKATDNLLNESKDSDNLLNESKDSDNRLNESKDIDERNNYVSNIIGDVLRETENRVDEHNDAEYHNYGRNEDMTRQCRYCSKKFGWLVDLTSHMMKEHEPFKKTEVIADPMPYLIGELMSELGEEMEGMRYRTEKYQKDITKQLNFQTQTLKQDLLREIKKIVNQDTESNVKEHHKNNIQINESQSDTKRIVACHNCEKEAGENLKHFHCLDCDKFFGNAKVLNRHIQSAHTEEIKTICDAIECHNSKKQMEITIKSLIETIHENTKVMQDALDANEILKEQNLILQNMHAKNEFNQIDDEQSDANDEGSSTVQFKCKNCDFTTSEPNVLKNHIGEKHKGSNLVCSKCPEKFTSQQLLKMHMNRDHKKAQNLPVGHPEKARQMNQQDSTNSFKCPECPEKFQIKKDWRNHILEHHTEDEFECVECREFFDTRGKLDEHIQMNHGEFLKEKKICRYYKQGRCTNHQCRFAHPEHLQPNNQNYLKPKQQNFQPMKQRRYQQQEQEQQLQGQQQNWIPACRRGPACSFLAQGRCFYFHRKQEQNQQQRNMIACKWMEDCKRVPYCPYQHYAGRDFPPLQQNQHQM